MRLLRNLSFALVMIGVVFLNVGMMKSLIPYQCIGGFMIGLFSVFTWNANDEVRKGERR